MQKHPNLKPLLVLLLVLCCIAVTATGTYAAFSTSGYVKRVIAAQTEEVSNAPRFSSNYLTVGKLNSKGNTLISVTGTGTSAVVGITVCNYPQDNSALFNTETITYTISFTVYGVDGTEIPNSGVTLSESGTSNTITLTGGQMSHILHTLTIPSNVLERISGGYIEVTATPSEPAGLSPLSAKLQIVQTAAQQVGWTGSVTGSDVDALNYQIHGTKTGTVTISWEPTVVSLSKWSAEMFTNKTLNDNSLIISVGGEDSPTSYLLQFYWVNGPKTSADAGFTCSFG